MRDWYERYYAAVERSAAYAEFCRRVFGANLGQHGFADMDQVRLLVEGLNLRAGDRILDLGCGNGGIIAGIAVQTGADVVGLDYSQSAIARRAGALCVSAHSVRGRRYRGRLL